MAIRVKKNTKKTSAKSKKGAKKKTSKKSTSKKGKTKAKAKGKSGKADTRAKARKAPKKKGAKSGKQKKAAKKGKNKGGAKRNTYVPSPEDLALFKHLVWVTDNEDELVTGNIIEVPSCHVDQKHDDIVVVLNGPTFGEDGGLEGGFTGGGLIIRNKGRKYDRNASMKLARRLAKVIALCDIGTPGYHYEFTGTTWMEFNPFTEEENEKMRKRIEKWEKKLEEAEAKPKKSKKTKGKNKAKAKGKSTKTKSTSKKGKKGKVVKLKKGSKGKRTRAKKAA